MDGDAPMKAPRGPLHDANGRFAPGNPGRPKGSRNRMTRQLALSALQAFAVNQEEDMARLRRWFFPQYMQLMTRFIPREPHAPRPDLDDYAPAETALVLAAARAALEAVERGEAGLDALLAVLESDPTTLEPAPEGVVDGTSNDVKYVESTSENAPPALVDEAG